MASVFVARLSYTVPIEQIDALLEAHLAWLKQGHAEGRFLAWGPLEPRDGGLIFMRAADRAEAQGFAESDPFILGEVARFEIMEWTPRFLGPGLEAFDG